MDFMAYEDLVLGVASIGTGNATTTHNLFGAKVRLCQGDIVPDSNTTLAALNADSATFTGYAEKTITWNAPSRASDGSIEVVGGLSEWRPTDAVTPNNLFVAYVVNAAGNLVLAGRFDSPPIPMADALDSLLLTIRWRPTAGAIGNTIS